MRGQGSGKLEAEELVMSNYPSIQGGSKKVPKMTKVPKVNVFYLF
jgi:hypothetical protein